MTEALFVCAAFLFMTVLLGLGIRGRRRPGPEGQKPEVGMWVVDALFWSRMPVPKEAQLNERVCGQVVAVHRDGTMTVRDWVSGDEVRCLATGFVPACRDDAELMQRLRTEQDNKDMGESPSKLVH